MNQVFRYAGRKLTGVGKLKGKHSGRPAIIACSGPTFELFNLSWITPGTIVFSVNETIRKLGDSATYWVLADPPIIDEYKEFCPASVTVLAMRQAASFANLKTHHEVYTVNSLREIKDYDNGYEFFSRGTVMIGAVELGRWFGIRDFYVFGLDCYRTETQYYYDNRVHPVSSENVANKAHRVKDGVYVTQKLKKMIVKLEETKKSGLWDNINVWCLNSPDSQQKSVEHMDLGDFFKCQNQQLIKHS